MGLFNLSNRFPFHDVNNHRSRKEISSDADCNLIANVQLIYKFFFLLFTADINFNRIINDFNASYIDMNGKKKTGGSRGQSACFSREEDANLPRSVIFLLSPGQHVASGMRAVLYIGIPQQRQFSRLVATAVKQPVINHAES